MMHADNDDDAERRPLLSSPAHVQSQQQHAASIGATAAAADHPAWLAQRAAALRKRRTRWLAAALTLLVVGLVVMAVVLVVVRPSPYRDQVVASYRVHASGTLVSLSGLYAHDDGVASFFGVPYAAPPVGGRRWQPPAPFDTPWHGVRNARAPRASCVQPVSPAVPLDAQSEDCLTLDVHAPLASPSNDGNRNLTAIVAATRKLRPVMVFVHGGGLLVGCSTCLHGSPRRMAMTAAAGGVDDGFVSVSINYRLGMLGFLALRALATIDERNTTSGNYGVLDVIASLRWVHENIEAFGGDPRRVTVWGQSSGATLVYALLTAPAARPYFSSAIALSGSPRLVNTLEQAYEQNAAALLPTFGRCANMTNTTHLLDCAYSLTAREAVDAQPALWSDAVGWGWPTLREYDPHLVATAHASVPYLLVADGVLLPHFFPAAFERGAAQAAQVPTLIGGMHDEFDMMPNVVYNASVTFAAYERSLESAMHALMVPAHSFPVDWASNVRAQYSGGKNATDRPDGKGYPSLQTPQQAYSAVAADARMTCGNFRVAAALSAGRAASQPTSDAPIYVYNMLFKPTFPYCITRYLAGVPGAYCAHYAFHLLDYMLAVDDGLFTAPLAGDYGRVRDRRFATHFRALIGEFVASGGRIARFAEYPAINTIDMANSTDAAFELRNSTEFKRRTCQLWAEADAFDKWADKN